VPSGARIITKKKGEDQLVRSAEYIIFGYHGEGKLALVWQRNRWNTKIAQGRTKGQIGEKKQKRELFTVGGRGQPKVS